ncbi:protein neprosin-like isoform X3 [Primulina eburnea]|uniref:protein neprosin-like isoform X3 n=1 Tax=Primulina eburnea TaxID=1245227 RepID=UPI003C6C8CF7
MGRVSVVRQGRFSCPSYSGNSILQSCSLFLVFLSFFLVLFSKKTMAVSTSLNYTKYKQVSSLRLARIQRRLDKINKPPVFTIQSPDGDIIDCIHKRKQPALDHPLLQKHKIQRVAPEMPKVMKTVKTDGFSGETNSSNSFDERLMGGAGWQMWHQNGLRCPKGTIPVRRSTSHDVLRAKSLYDFGKKQKTAGMAQFASRLSSVDAPDVVNGNGHEVSPELYGDNRPRLFTYWTSDAYQATGCYNLLCSGFVQTNSRIAIGAAISPVSSMGGNQYDITILIWKDPKLGNWWMRFGDNTLVGYWPNELFTHLADRATMVEWGGEIVNSGTNDEHTTTQMGSGQFAQDGFGKASYFRNLEIVDSDNSLTTAQDISVLAENSNCYNILSSRNSEWGTHFYYGGPGRNPSCQ